MKQQGSSNIRLGPICQTGYIMSNDLHPRCESCLGPEHAGLALLPGANCAFCKLLEEPEGCRRAEGSPLEPKGSDYTDTPPASAQPTGIGAPVQLLPGIIHKAATSLQLTVPFPQEAPGRTRRTLFPGIDAYLASSAEEPGQLKSPVLSYIPIKRVVGISNKGFPPVPPLEPRLASVFGVMVNPLGDGDLHHPPLQAKW
ncbi:unnamed protein product [Pleuronectes platessa]|uniref:Uncharacterized protein n=1 Tax=Pleuronectes platessa TaxID=8262 RepID=A0A9N7UJC3_PLEPL|nr:unnamed protein product [Pleuronectes platessa]